MTKRDRDRRDDRRDSQPDQEQGYRMGDGDPQEGESLTALKGILAKVASLLKPMQLTQEESIRLVEQMYESFLDMDVKLAGESDETRKSQVLSHIQNVVVKRDADRLVVEYPPAQAQAPERVEAASAEPRPAGAPAAAATQAAPPVARRPAPRPSPAPRLSPAPRPESAEGTGSDGDRPDGDRPDTPAERPSPAVQTDTPDADPVT